MSSKTAAITEVLMVSAGPVAHPELARPIDQLRRIVRDFGAWLRRPKSAPGDALRVQVGSGAHFDALRPYAASPARREMRTDDGTTLWLEMPAAGPHNTAVVWDAGRQKLRVGVWSTRLDRIRGQEGDSAASGPRLSWYADVWRPDHDGARATARVARGCVAVHLPRHHDASTRST
jgi:hypothetical protein